MYTHTYVWTYIVLSRWCTPWISSLLDIRLCWCCSTATCDPPLGTFVQGVEILSALSENNASHRIHWFIITSRHWNIHIPHYWLFSCTLIFRKICIYSYIYISTIINIYHNISKYTVSFIIYQSGLTWPFGLGAWLARDPFHLRRGWPGLLVLSSFAACLALDGVPPRPVWSFAGAECPSYQSLRHVGIIAKIWKMILIIPCFIDTIDIIFHQWTNDANVTNDTNLIVQPLWPRGPARVYLPAFARFSLPKQRFSLFARDLSAMAMV